MTFGTHVTIKMNSKIVCIKYAIKINQLYDLINCLMGTMKLVVSAN